MTSLGTYTAREVAELAGLSLRRVQGLVRAGLLVPQEDARFTYQDLVFLRQVRDLAASRVPPRRMDRALRGLKERLHTEGLAEVALSADAGAIVAQTRGRRWDAASGQLLLDFTPAPAPVAVAGLDADGWFAAGCEAEETHPDEARAAYERALELAPRHADALVNLGRLEHAAGRLEGAETRYRAALEARPDDETAAFNLGVVLEDLGRPADARLAYRRAVALSPTFADAHFNLARLCEAQGDNAEAIRHLGEYRRLVLGRR